MASPKMFVTCVTLVSTLVGFVAVSADAASKPAAVSATTVTTASAASAAFTQVVAAQSRADFVFRQMNVPVQGHFPRFAAQLNFNPAQLDKSFANLDIDLSQIDAGSDEANAEVKSATWFNVRDYPRAKFVSSKITTQGNGKYLVTGTLTLKGKSREISAPLVVTTQGKQAVLDASLPLKRIDFGIGNGEWLDTSVVANEVQVKVRLVALQP